MAQINKYTDAAAYAADTSRLATKSAVSYIESDARMIYSGVNVLVDKPAAGIGDLVVYDKEVARARYVKASTLVKDQLPASLIPVGVVYAHIGDRVLIVALNNTAGKRWAASYEVALTGFDLVNGGSFVLTMATGATQTPANTTYTYPAGSTLADIAAIIAVTMPNYNKVDYGGWTAAADATLDAVVLTSNTYNHARQSTIEAVSGCTIVRTPEDAHYQTMLTGTLIEGSVEYIRRNNRVNTSYTGVNYAKFLQYYGINGQTPGSTVYIGSDTIVNKAAFEGSEFCAGLRIAYLDYADYLYGEHFVQYPCAYGTILRDGKVNTSKIAGLRFTDIRGDLVPCYPAAAAAADYGISADVVTGFEPGAWWLPSVEETFLLMRDRAYGAATWDDDPVNTTLYLMGKSSIYGNEFYTWTSCEYSSNGAYIYSGGSGGVNTGYKCSALSVRPVSAL